MAALERALALEPRNVRGLLQKASLLELQDTRRGAAAYRIALQAIPLGAEPPAAMLPVLQHARQTVEANNGSSKRSSRNDCKLYGHAMRRSHSGASTNA